MAYLLARCPMLGCNHRTLVCDLHSESMPSFEPGIYVAVKCAHCGEIFRETVARLELCHCPGAGAASHDMSQTATQPGPPSR